MPDTDSFHDPFLACAVAASAVPGLGVMIGGTDAIRRGPAELLQSMLSLADLTDGRALCCVAAGEVKQISPFGHNRSEGLHRLEDVLRIVRLLSDCDGPVDYEGNIWKLRAAYIGCIRRQLPEFWAIGAGPKLIELASAYADGFMSVGPNAMPTPERYGEVVATLRTGLAAAGRTSDDFGFGLIFEVLCHDDPAVIEAALDNGLLKFLAAMNGRLNQRDWLAEGVEPVFPPPWHYALHLLPSEMTLEVANDAIERVSPEMMRKSFLIGTPEEIADQILDYVRVGVNLIAPADCLPLALGSGIALESFGRMLQVLALVRKKAEKL
jgi:phthiodiolone/phenolphthiodiolone dimycocerosates ketoreductase